jgi:hypothetical protein
MAILNKLITIMPAFGAPTEYVTLLGQAVVNTATTTNYVLTGFINFVRSGRVRFKIIPPAGAAGQITAITITATDGTTTVTLYQDAVARTAGTNLDFLYSFISDLNLTTVTIAVTTAAAGAASTADVEITGNP